MASTQAGGLDFDEGAKDGPQWAQEAAAMIVKNQPEKAFQVASEQLRSRQEGEDAFETLQRFYALHTMAKAELQMGALLSAQQLCERAKEDCSEQKAEAQVVHSLAKIYLQLHRIDDATRCAKEALDIFRQCGHALGEASALLTVAKASVAQGLREDALKAVLRSQALFQKHSEHAGELSARRLLCRLHLEQRRFEAAQEVAEAALSLCEDESVDLDFRGTALMLVAEVQDALGDEEKSGNFAEKAVQLFEDAGAKRQQAHCLRRLADMSFARKQMADGWGYIKEALALYREAGHRKGEASTLCEISLAHFRMNNDEEAQRIADEGLAICMEHGFKEQLGHVHNIIAEFSMRRLSQLRAQGDSSQRAAQLSWKARRAAKEAFTILAKLGNLKGQAQALSVLACAFLELGNLSEVREKAHEAAKCCKEMGDKPGEGNAYLFAAQARLYDNEQEAVRLARLGLKLVKEGGGSAAQVADAQQVVDFILQKVTKADAEQKEASVLDAAVGSGAASSIVFRDDDMKSPVAVIEGIQGMLVRPVQ